MKMPRLVLQPPSLAAPRDFICRPLLGSWEGRDEDTPYVAVAEGHSNGAFELARRQGRDRAAIQALVEAAWQNALAAPWKWSVAEQRGFLWFKRPSLLRAIGDTSVPISEMTTEGGGVDDLSAEVILNPAALKEAAELLRAPQLIAVIPKRGWLLIAAGEHGNIFASQGLHDAADGIASRGGKHALSRTVFLVADGAVVGIDVRRGGSGFLSMLHAEESAWLV
jgi:hypothetical protein